MFPFQVANRSFIAQNVYVCLVVFQIVFLIAMEHDRRDIFCGINALLFHIVGLAIAAWLCFEGEKTCDSIIPGLHRRNSISVALLSEPFQNLHPLTNHPYSRLPIARGHLKNRGLSASALYGASDRAGHELYTVAHETKWGQPISAANDLQLRYLRHHCCDRIGRLRLRWL